MTLKVYEIDGIVPVVDPTAFVHPSAVLIGDVIVGPGCYIGPCASLRGDFGHIQIRPDFSIVELPAELPAEVWKKLENTRISGKLIELSEDRGPARPPRTGPGTSSDDAPPSREKKPRHKKG